jgi:hypothetical protein
LNCGKSRIDTLTERSHGPSVVVVVVVVVGLFDNDNDNDNVPGISVTTSVLIAPHEVATIVQASSPHYTLQGLAISGRGCSMKENGFAAMSSPGSATDVPPRNPQ